MATGWGSITGLSAGHASMQGSICLFEKKYNVMFQQMCLLFIQVQSSFKYLKLKYTSVYLIFFIFIWIKQKHTFSTVLLFTSLIDLFLPTRLWKCKGWKCLKHGSLLLFYEQNTLLSMQFTTCNINTETRDIKLLQIILVWSIYVSLNV